MEITSFKIQGLQLITLRSFPDDRGYFVERYNKMSFAEAGIQLDFIQDNFSRSRPGVLRGLHYQHSPTQAKLVSCLHGRILDVAVDLRKNSPTFGQYEMIELDSAKPQWFLIPAGFAHGFLVTSSDPADVLYKVDNYYNPKGEGAIRWNDSIINIQWPQLKPIVSEKDSLAQSWDEFLKINPF